MRLLIVTFDPPENVGGIEGRAVGYTRELVARQVPLSVVSVSKVRTFSAKPFFGTVLYQYSSRLRYLPLVLVHVIRKVRSGPDGTVFLLSGGITLLGVMILLFARITGRNSATFYYGKDILQGRQSLESSVLLAASIRLSRRIVTNSWFTRSLLPEKFRRKIAVLYPSADCPSGQATIVKDDKKKILFVGRLVPRKGVDDLIEAFRLIREEVPGVTLELVGDGEDRQRLQRLVRKNGLDDEVTFFGTLRGEALHDRYRLCSVFAMPSKTLADDVEGFGTVFLEAGCFSKPSVGTFSGGIPEAILDGATGMLVREGDIDGLVAALEKLLVDSDFSRKLGDNAHRRVLDEFTWKRGTDMLVRILESKKEAT